MVIYIVILNRLGHKTNMVTMPIYDKNQQSSSPEQYHDW